MYERSRSMTTLMLRRFDTDYGDKESRMPEDTSIEHVMPQMVAGSDRNCTWWQAALGPDWQAVHERWLHSMGNLTLTRKNSEMGNRPFSRVTGDTWPSDITECKRYILENSPIVSNKRIAANATWGEPEISARAKDLADRAVRIWPLPAGIVGV
jgi:hypothetical protein